MRCRLLRLGATAALTCLIVVAAQAQQPQPAGGRGQQPPAGPGGRGAGRAPTAPPPINWPSPPLADGPIVLDTALQRPIRLVVTKGLQQPWSMAFLPDGGILVTERPGRLRIVRNGVLDPAPVKGLPAVQAAGLAGLMDIALHPRFAENSLVYITYHKPAAGAAPAPGPGGGPGTITLARGEMGRRCAGRVAGHLLGDSVGQRVADRVRQGRQRLHDHRLRRHAGRQSRSGRRAAAGSHEPRGQGAASQDDGTVPADNPFVGRSNSRPEIFTIGHRNMLGLAVHPDTGAIWETENGPNGGDEINVLQAGKNYGWPVVSYGRFYLGPRVNETPWQEGMEQPLVFWVPAIATSGLTFYTGDRFPQWKGHVFAGAMRQGEVPRSGHLDRIDFNDKWEELHRESMLWELHQRVRDVRQGPDGLLYLLTAENDGALIRIEPGPAPVK